MANKKSEIKIQVEVDENNEANGERKVDEMCKKLLANLVIEDYKIL